MLNQDCEHGKSSILAEGIVHPKQPVIVNQTNLSASPNSKKDPLFVLFSDKAPHICCSDCL